MFDTKLSDKEIGKIYSFIDKKLNHLDQKLRSDFGSRVAKLRQTILDEAKLDSRDKSVITGQLIALENYLGIEFVESSIRKGVSLSQEKSYRKIKK